MGQRLTVDNYDELPRKIDSVTHHCSKAYYKAALKRVFSANPENDSTVCDYIIAEQTQMNIASTEEGKIKVLIWLSNYFENKKSFRQMTKQDILDYLNDLRKPVPEDPTHRWIDSYNGRQMIFNEPNPSNIPSYDVFYTELAPEIPYLLSSLINPYDNPLLRHR